MSAADRPTSRHRASVRGVVAVVVASVLALLVGLVPATAAQAGDAEPHDPAPQVENAALRIVLDSTADETTLVLRPGAVIASHPVSVTPGARLTRVPGGWRLQRPLGRARAVIDTVYRETAGADEIAVTLATSDRGRARVDIVNRNGDPHPVATVTTDEPGPAVGTVRRPRADVFGSVPLRLPHADARPLVLAFYYPWFDDYDDGRLADRPATPRSTRVPTDVGAMTRQARAHGIDGFVVSWAGEEADGEGFDTALRAAERAGQTVTGYLEVGRAAAAGGPDELVARRVRHWLAQLLDRASSPAFLRSDGVPVVFVYGMGRVSPVAWQAILDDLTRTGHPVRLVGDADSDDYAAVAWGEHQFTALGSPAARGRFARDTAARARARVVVDPTAHPRLYAATVAPGYDDRGIRSGNPVVPRGAAGERYTATWEAALSADPDWVLVNSWNEWFEGTAVEPGVTAGDRSLRQTARSAGPWKAGERDRWVQPPPAPGPGVIGGLHAVVGRALSASIGR